MVSFCGYSWFYSVSSVPKGWIKLWVLWGFLSRGYPMFPLPLHHICLLKIADLRAKICCCRRGYACYETPRIETVGFVWLMQRKEECKNSPHVHVIASVSTRKCKWPNCATSQCMHWFTLRYILCLRAKHKLCSGDWDGGQWNPMKHCDIKKDEITIMQITKAMKAKQKPMVQWAWYQGGCLPLVFRTAPGVSQHS